MKKTLNWILFGVATFITSLLYTIPAHIAPPYFPDAIQATGVSGTVWKGHAARLEIENFNFGEVTWHIKPVHLLIGRLKSEFEFKRSDLNGEGDVVVKMSSLGVENAYFSGDSKFLEPYISPYGISVSGEFGLTIDSFYANAQGPESARGQLQWHEARFNSPANLALGEVTLDLDQQGTAAIATITNTGNALSVDGKANLKQNWEYGARIRLAPTPSTPPDIRQGLALFGRPDPQGGVTLSRSGQLPLTSMLSDVGALETQH
jgi:general secretion pathway protein N